MSDELPITEVELQAYVDGRLAAARRTEVDAWLSARPEEAERIAAYRGVGEDLRSLYDQVLAESVPEEQSTTRLTGGSCNIGDRVVAVHASLKHERMLVGARSLRHSITARVRVDVVDSAITAQSRSSARFVVATLASHALRTWSLWTTLGARLRAKFLRRWRRSSS